MVDGLERYLDQGVLGLTVFALIVALIWTVKQWRQAERERELLHEARLQDAKEMVGLSNEVKNTLETLVHTLSQRNGGG